MENDWVARIVLSVAMIGSGILLIWLANAAASGRLKRNHLAGVRIPSTLASDEAWLAAHVRAQRSTISAGVVSLGSGALALLPLSMPIITVGLLVAAMIALGVVLHGARIGAAAAKAASED